MKIIIIGAGEVGFHIANHLALEKKDVVVIDREMVALRRVSDAVDVQIINGSGSSPAVLEEAGVADAEIVLAVTNSDETNLVACLVANILSPSTKKLARIRSASFDAYHESFRKGAPHIDTLINPDVEVLKTIDGFIRVPGAVDVGEFAQGRVKLVGVNLESSSDLCGVQLSVMAERLADRRPLIAAVVRNEQLIIPQGKDRLEAGDRVYFVAEDESLLETLALFGKHSEPVRRVLIVGGGRIGLRLAELMESRGIYTKIIEINSDRCIFLADRLNRTVVLHGDGSDKGLLIEENIQDMDVVVTLTGDEEINILVSLLARQMGARKTITKISKFSYLPMMPAIGLEQVVSPRLSAINSILHHIRRGKVLSAISIQGEQAEVIEAVAMETSDIVSRPLKNVSLPKGVLVTGIIRGEQVIVPTGDSVIEPNDHIILFARREAITKLEKILAVKLEFF